LAKGLSKWRVLLYQTVEQTTTKVFGRLTPYEGRRPTPRKGENSDLWYKKGRGFLNSQPPGKKGDIARILGKKSFKNIRRKKKNDMIRGGGGGVE